MGWLGRLFGKREAPARDLTGRDAGRARVWAAVRAGRGVEIARARCANLAAANQLLERMRGLAGCDAAAARSSDEPGEWEVVVSRGGRIRTGSVRAPQPDWPWIERHDLDERLVREVNGLFGPRDRQLYLADVAEHEEDDRGALLYLPLDEARALAAAGAFLQPRPPSDEDLAMLDEEDEAYERELREEAEADAAAAAGAEVEAPLYRVDGAVEGLAVVGDTIVTIAEHVLSAAAQLGQGARRTLPIAASAIAPHDDRLYVGDTGGTVHVLDGGLRTIASRRVAESAICSIAAGDDAILVAAVELDDLLVLDPRELVERRRLSGSNAPPGGTCVLGGGRCGGGDQTPVRYRIWDARDGRELAEVAIPDATVTMCAARSPDGTRLAVVADLRGVLLDAVTFAKLGDLHGAWACAWTPAGTLVVGDTDTLRELDRDGRELAATRPFDGDGWNVSAIAPLDDGRVVAGFERGHVWIGCVRPPVER